MPGKPITIGPFSSGLNNISTSGEAEDNEVIQLVNMEVSRDTSLTSRPPIRTVEGSVLPSTNTTGWEVLGIYRVTRTEWYLIASYPTSATNDNDVSVRAYPNGDLSSASAILVRNIIGLNNRPTGMVQFKDMLYFLVGSDATDSGFKWQKGMAAGGTAVTAMPKGNVIISWKTRLWISGETKVGTNPVQYDRVYFSTINASGPQPDTWGAEDFFDVAPGEGGFNTAMLASFNNLIIFKTDGTWRFSFPSSPTQGVVEKLSGQVGAANANCAVEYENYIFVYDQGIIYELINSNFTQVNRFVRFNENIVSVDSGAPDVDLSILNRRLVVRYFNAIFVYTIDTKSWSQWFSYNGTPGRFYELPTDSSSAVNRGFIAASKGTIQAASSNFIVDSSFQDPIVNTARQGAFNADVSFYTLNGETYMSFTKGSAGNIAYTYLNRTGSNSEYDTPVAPGQKFEFSAKVDHWTGTETVGFRITYLRSDNTTTAQSIPITSATPVSEHIVPANAVLANVAVYVDAADAKIGFSNPKFTRKSGNSPRNLLQFIDQYENNVGAIEYIDCWFETKSYDYQAAPAFKRLFYWGADLKTPRAFIAEARPVAKQGSISWGDLNNYTWTQLEQGTWGNPLDWLNKSTAIIDYTEAQEEISDNGRFFAKILKSIRFRQISFYIKFSTLGTLETGPVKLFSLTTMVTPKQDVVDKIS